MGASIIRRWHKIILIIVCVVVALSVFAVWRHLSQPIGNNFPHIQLVLEENRTDTQPNGHLVGCNFIYYNKDGSYQYDDIPSLQGVWQLDEPYAKHSSITLNNDTEYISVFCAEGKLRKPPNDIHVVRFSMDVVTGEPGNTPDWSEGIEVSLDRHGNFYRIYDPVPNSVYVSRTVWGDGVLEYAWAVKIE